MGFNLNLTTSRRSSLDVMNRSDKTQLEEVKRIIMKQFIAKKFKHPSLEPMIVQGDLQAMATALQGVRLKTVYLIWRNPRFENYPSPLSALQSH